MLLIARMDHEKFNQAARDGSADQKINRIVEAIAPEAAYFAALDGRRTAVMVVDMKDASQIPSLAEPWFLTFDADVEFHPVMTPQDVAKAGLDELGKQWA
jgi:hypothetical protein